MSTTNVTKEQEALDEILEALKTWAKCGCEYCSGPACQAMRDLYQTYRRIDAGKSA